MKIYSRPMEILESRSSNMDIKKYKKIKGIVSSIFCILLLSSYMNLREKHLYFDKLQAFLVVKIVNILQMSRICSYSRLFLCITLFITCFYHLQNFLKLSDCSKKFNFLIIFLKHWTFVKIVISMSHKRHVKFVIFENDVSWLVPLACNGSLMQALAMLICCGKGQ